MEHIYRRNWYLYYLILVANNLGSMLRDVARLSTKPQQSTRERYRRRVEVRVKIEEYSKSECLTLCLMMQEKLPRELRDMVYEALLGEPQTYYFDDDAHGLGFSDPANIVAHNPHIGDKLFLGEETITELAEMWYRHSVFNFLGDATVALLFGNQTWALPELDPARLIRHVYMTLAPRDRQNNIRYQAVEARDELLLPSDLEQLAKLQQPATFTIGIYLGHWIYHGETREDTKTSIDTMFRRVFPMLKQLIASGVGVALEIYKTEPVKVELKHLDSESWLKLVRGTHLRQ